LETINYCSKFVKNLSSITESLYEWLKRTKVEKSKDVSKFISEKAIADFELVKKEICKDVELTIPTTKDKFN
jgi:hypothetical protein